MATITGISAGTLVIEQTMVTRYLALAETAGGFTVPDPALPISDRHFQPIRISRRG
jgi:hypothetical protein